MSTSSQAASFTSAKVLVLLAGAMACNASPAAEYLDGRCSFATAAPVLVGTQPHSVAVGEINGDGNADIAVANEASNDVSVALGLGGGAFAASTSWPSGTAPRSVALADVSGDGKLDLLAAAWGSNAVTLRVGTGTGSFGGLASLPVGGPPRALAIADLTGDGVQDVVTANGSANTISVLLGTGSGDFAAAVSYAVGGNPGGVAIADFNGDGKVDVAVANEASNNVTLQLGSGAGTFGPGTPFAVGSQPRAITSADFNADNRPDVAVANWNSGTVSVLVGTPEGNFGAATHFAASALPTSLAAADLDADGHAELVVANETSSPNIVTVLKGLGGAAFGAPSTVRLDGIRPESVAIGNIDADSVPDLVVANFSSGTASLLLGDCAPLLDVPPTNAADATSSYELRKSRLWFARGAHVAIAADFNRDGWTDVVAGQNHPPGTSGPATFLLNAGNDTFIDMSTTVVTNAQPGIEYPRKGLAGDFNGDGWPDAIMLATGTDLPPFPGEVNQLFLSNGNGTLRFSTALSAFGAGYHHAGASADIDGNDTVDVLVQNAGALGVVQSYFLINDGAGNFTRSTNRLPSEFLDHPIFTAEMLDIDGDGYIDIVSGGHEFSSNDRPATIYWGGRSGLYRASAKTILPKLAGFGGVLDFAAEDIDRDGDRDLIVDRFPDSFVTNSRYFQILRQVSPRQFADETATRMTMASNQPGVDFIRVQDINGDAWPDIFVDNRALAEAGEFAWANDGSGAFAPYFGPVRPSLSLFASGFE